jgi:hypothetical protein
MSQKRLYEPGYQLKENEYLLKIRPASRWHSLPTGFLSKLTKKGEIPKAFTEWSTERHWHGGKLIIKAIEEIYVVTEDFKAGWKLIEWRFGQS